MKYDDDGRKDEFFEHLFCCVYTMCNKRSDRRDARRAANAKDGRK